MPSLKARSLAVNRSWYRRESCSPLSPMGSGMRRGYPPPPRGSGPHGPEPRGLRKYAQAMGAAETGSVGRENVRNTELLDAELPSPRFVDDAYLHWLYDENPYGPAIQRAADDGGVRVAHYAMVPQRYRGPDGVVPAAFSLNAVV